MSYTVHLGDFTHNKSDFSVAANSNYEYTLTINGVNNFIAESQKNSDDPGSEGVVIFKGTDILEVDCHYEARVMKFSMSELNQIINVDKYGYILKIQTAFCETISMIVDGEGRIYDAAEFKTQSNPTVLTTVGADGMPVDASRILISGDVDFDWVRFVKNTGYYSSDYTPSQNLVVRFHPPMLSQMCAHIRAKIILRPYSNSCGICIRRERNRLHHISMLQARQSMSPALWMKTTIRTRTGPSM